MSNYGGPLAGLDSAIDRIAPRHQTPAERLSDAKPPEQGIYRDHWGRMVHVRRHSNGTVTEHVISHHG